MKRTKRIPACACILVLSCMFLSQAYPDAAAGYYERLKKLTAEKNFKPALELALKAMKEYPDQEGFFLYGIWSYRESGRLDEAVSLGRSAMKKWPESMLVKENLAWALTYLARNIIEKKTGKDPLPFAREGYELHPCDGTMLWLGLSLKHNGLLDEAEKIFSQGIEKYPGNKYFKPNLLYLYLERARDAREKGDRQSAREQFYLAYSTDPTNESALLWFAIILRESKEFAEAARLLAEGKAKFPKNSYFAENLRWTYFEWAGSLLDLDRVEKAREVLGKARALLPSDPFIVSQLAMTYFRRDHKKWEALARESLALVPRDKQKARGTYQVPLASGRIFVHQGNNENVTHLGIGAGYAWDFVLVDEKNSYGKTWERKEDHLVFGQPVYAAREGTVHEVYDASPDTEPGKNGPYDVNRILIRHEDGELSYYAHLKKGSALVKKGQAVKKGQRIALVGCSGRYVDFPHLHFQVIRENICVEARISGAEVLEKGAWRNPGPFVPKKKDVMRSTWEK